jgi:hypothetical protein
MALYFKQSLFYCKERKMKRVIKTVSFALLLILLTTILFIVLNKKNEAEKQFIGKVTFIELGSKNCIDCIKM